METRHEQQDSTDPQPKGLSDIIREGKSASLNRAKDALKRRLMQTLMQQVLDEMEQDADEVAQQAIEHLQDEEDLLADVKEKLKTQLLAQIMEEAIAEIDEEVAGGESGTHAEPADHDTSDDAEDRALFGESMHEEETFTETGEEEREPTEGALDDDDHSAEESGDDEVAGEFETAEDEERPEASADTVWTWNEPETPSEEEEDVAESEFEETSVEPFGDDLDVVAPMEDDTLPEIEPSAPVDVEPDAAEPEDEPFTAPEHDEEAPDVVPEIEEGDAEPRMDVDSSEDVTTEDADAAYLDDAFNEWADPSDASDDDFLKHDFSASDDAEPPTGGDTAPFKDLDEIDSALTFEDEVPPVEDSDVAADEMSDPTSAFSLKEYEIADFSPEWGDEGEADESDAGVEAHPAVDETVAWEETFHEPADSEDEDGLAYYLYGIVASDQELPDEAFPQGGIDEEHPVFIMQEGGLRALVSRVPAETYGPHALQEHMDQEAWAQSHVRRHEQILEQLMQYSALVPMQFGTVYPSEIALRDMLRDQQTTFSETLDRLEGTQEWSLTIRCDLEVLRRDVMEDSTKVQELLQDMRSKPRGVAQFIKKKMVVAIHDEVKERREDCVEASHEAISKFAEDVRVKTTVDDEDDAAPVHAASYLVRKPDEGDFMGEVERLRGIYGHQGFAYEVSGPWPPYSFAASPPAPSAVLETEDADSLDA